MTQLTTAPRPLALRDGAVVEVRPLRPDDRAEIAAAVARLSERSRYLRFASPKPRLTERELDHLLDVDHRASEALIAIDPATGRCVAEARYAAVPGESGVAEVAVTVADEWQGRGLGGALLASIVDRAGAEGRSALRASVLAVNDRSIAMLRRAEFAIRSAGALCEFERRLTPPA